MVESYSEVTLWKTTLVHTRYSQNMTPRQWLLPKYHGAKMFAVFLHCVLRDYLCLTPEMGCAHMDDHRACRVTSVHTLSTTTKEDWKQMLACGWCVAQTLLLTRVAKTTSTWRLSAAAAANCWDCCNCWKLSKDSGLSANCGSIHQDVHHQASFTMFSIIRCCCCCHDCCNHLLNNMFWSLANLATWQWFRECICWISLACNDIQFQVTESYSTLQL